MHQEVLQELYSLWIVTVRERDEASERLQNSLTKLSQIQKLFNNVLLTEEQQVSQFYYPEESNLQQNCNYNHFFGDSSSQFSFASPLDFVSNQTGIGISSPAISDSGSYSSSSNQMSFNVQNIRDYETVVLEFIGGVLPENGKFLQAVTKATSLVESQLVTGPVPKWRNPPVQVLDRRPVLSNTIGLSNTGKRISGGLQLGSGMLNRSFPCKKARFSL